MCECSSFSDEYIRSIYKEFESNEGKEYGHFLFWQIKKHNLPDYQFNDELLDFLEGEFSGINEFLYRVKPIIKSAYYNGKLNLDRWLQEAVRKDLIPNGELYSIHNHLDVASRLYFKYMMETFISNDLMFLACIEIMNDIQENYGYKLKYDECQKVFQEIECISQNSIMNTNGILYKTVLKCFPDLGLAENDKIHVNNITDAKLDPNKEFIVSFDKSEERPEDECKMKPTPSGNKSMTGILSKEGYFVATNN